MAKPIVAVVGRPNVGKSTFFNKMAGARISIVEDTPGVTRDRVYADVSWQNYDFTLVDTGGIDPYSDDPLLTQMRAQANIAIETADVILFFVDGREGLTGADYEVADMLRRTKKPVLLVVNKLDTPIKDVDRMDFFALGIGEPLPISSVNLLGIGDLLEELCKLLPDPEEAPAGEDEEGPLKIAVVGRPNVGKSSLVNAILGQERVMVSDIAGTTRDAIDTPFRDNGRDYIIIDTAGIRRKAKVKEASLERYSVIRSLAAIRRCDCALLLIDAQEKTVFEPLTAQSAAMEQVYDFDLQQGGGHLTGWKLTGPQMDAVAKAMTGLCTTEEMERKYGVKSMAPLLFAVGDGNHSLATAKECYERQKRYVSEDKWAELPSRYALCEVVNLHDSSLEFEPIHRVVFGVKARDLLS